MSEQSPGSPADPPVGGLGLSVVPLLLSSPSEAFRRLGADPKWIGQLIVMMLLIGVATWIRMPQDIVVQYETTEGMLERMGADDEAIDEALLRIPDPDELTGGDVAKHVLPAMLGVTAFSFLGVLAFWLIARVSGLQPGFHQAAAVYWTAHLAGGVGYLALAGLVRMTDSVEVALSPAALVPGLEWGSPVYAFLNIFDVFSVATLYLLATGARWTFGASSRMGWIVGGIYWTLGSVLGFASQLFGSWAMGRN
ncbi:MAG TPA: hypothetical protein VKU85_12715 [bacterium]|nr:hypothetical protein [bacterium]